MHTLAIRFAIATALMCCLLATTSSAAGPADAKAVAAKVDALLNAAYRKTGTRVSAATGDEDFLRRVTLDLAGRAPTPRELTLFVLDPDSGKRAKVVERLLASDDFAKNQARYWRDVVMNRATDQRARIAQNAFEQWLTKQFQQNRKWDEMTTALLTAKGDVREHGEAALIFAHAGDAKELAAETSRIFLGVQIQCANCHDHPTDVWKRKHFHQLAAFFPRMRVRPVRNEQNRIRSWEVVSADFGRRGAFADPGGLVRRFDKNRDNKISKDEVKGTRLERFFDRLLRRLDRNNDKALTAVELKRGRQFAQRRRGGGVEYFMPNLEDPSSRGTKMEPVFFVGDQSIKAGLNDVARREELARLVTSKDNKWFARAFVNRIWAEMLGEGFYMPIDDLGPQRKARFPKAIDELATGFTNSGYDVKWLFRTIANTQAYQRGIVAKSAADGSPPFASASATRLRSDQIYNSLTQALGVTSLGGNRFRGRRRGPYGRFGERFQFSQLFGFDPSTPQEDVVGTVPQALFLMNSAALNNLIRGTGRTRLAQILRENSNNNDALTELYLMVLARDPSKKERKICKDYIAKVGNRTEAFEDVLWGLLNSSEFLTKR
ncbi:MAG: DUF1549 domain-containing protein [Planctomycetaceae bacterium]